MIKIKIATILFSLLETILVPGKSINPFKNIPRDTININGAITGRIFEGIGAVSAGASSRLLIDYPEPYRSDILDYLFKPDFGAGFTYLKTEIGGDGNSTCGSEPSFARTRAEMTHPNYNRGYEYWLMKEARKRNKEIKLDALEWCMPGWFTSVWSQDNADYLVKFIKGAKHWGVNMNYIEGCWNERQYNRDWIVNVLRPTLDSNGLSDIKINAPEGAGPSWAICDQLIKDSVFRKTLSAVNYHYPDSYMGKDTKIKAGSNAFNCGLPLWSGEDFSLSGKPWKNAMNLAKNVLECYIKQKIVQVNLWCPIASMPDNACFSNVGVMKGNTPWSGYYEVWPAIWAVAHFNQFVQPGWIYIDSGCGILSGGGAYCTYKKPDGSGNYSVVLVNGHIAQKVTFNISNLSNGTLHVWRSNSKSQFIKQPDITPFNGSFTITLDAESIYSITTTTGQSKGAHVVPEQESFPVDYSDNFESYSLTKAPLTPKYFCDNSGAFEIYQAHDESKCVRQMVDKDIIHWIPDSCAFTFVAQGTEWEDGEISSDVFVEENAFNGIGYAGIIARGSYDKASQANIPLGYRLNIYKNGTWKLQTKSNTLDSGIVDVNTWHNLKLVCNKRNIKAYIDGRVVANINDHTYLLGAVGYTSGWNTSEFDNLNIKYSPMKGHLISQWKVATSSSHTPDYGASNAFDGNTYSKWIAKDTNKPQWLMIDLGRAYNVNRCETFFEFSNKPYKYKIEYSMDNIKWHMFADNSDNEVAESPCSIDINMVKARYVRITIIHTPNEVLSGIYAFKVYGTISKL